MTPRQEERLRNKIQAAKENLRIGKRTFGFYDDSHGLRYEIGLLYFQLEDHAGLMKYHNWFYKNFEDDIGLPELHLAWINSSRILRKMAIFNRHLIELEEINLYLIPLLLEEKIDELPIWHGMNWSQKNYGEYVVEHYQKRMAPEVLELLAEITHQSNYQSFKDLLIQQKIKLKAEKVVKKRKKIMAAEAKIVEEWRKSLS